MIAGVRSKMASKATSSDTKQLWQLLVHGGRDVKAAVQYFTGQPLVKWLHRVACLFLLNISFT